MKKALTNRHRNCTELSYESDRDAALALVVLKWALTTLSKLGKEKIKKLRDQEL